MTRLSAHSIAEAVDSEGKSWGLSARIVGDKVKVCDTVTVAVSVAGCMVLEDFERPLCTVDEDHPFSGALANRVDNGETDLARRFRLAEQIDKKAKQKKADDYDAETRAQWRSRRRIFAGPSGIIPAGLSNRSYRGGQ